MGLFQVFVCIGDVLVAHFRAKKSSACWSSTCRPSIQFDTSFWREAGGQQFQSDCNWTGGTNEHTEFHHRLEIGAARHHCDNFRPWFRLGNGLLVILPIGGELRR